MRYKENLRSLLRHAGKHGVGRVTIYRQSDDTALLTVSTGNRWYAIRFASYHVLTNHFLRSRRSWRGVIVHVYSRKHSYRVEL
jgi:hypothetical protein